jgi:hypothetical protein
MCVYAHHRSFGLQIYVFYGFNKHVEALADRNESTVWAATSEFFLYDVGMCLLITETIFAFVWAIIGISWSNSVSNASPSADCSSLSSVAYACAVTLLVLVCAVVFFGFCTICGLFGNLSIVDQCTMCCSCCCPDCVADMQRQSAAQAPARRPETASLSRPSQYQPAYAQAGTVSLVPAMSYPPPAVAAPAVVYQSIPVQAHNQVPPRPYTHLPLQPGAQPSFQASQSTIDHMSINLDEPGAVDPEFVRQQEQAVR